MNLHHFVFSENGPKVNGLIMYTVVFLATLISSVLVEFIPAPMAG